MFHFQGVTDAGNRHIGDTSEFPFHQAALANGFHSANPHSFLAEAAG